jgi:hypothetical protein
METTINKTLSEIQRKIKVPKGQKNSFGNYMYRSCEDILEAVKPVLPQGVIILLSDEIVQIGDRYYVKATATITDEKQSITATAYAREQEKKLNKEGRETMDHAQITGSTSSYARKYALNGLLLIDDEKDADTKDNTEKTAPVKAVAKPVVKPVTVTEKDVDEKIVPLLKELEYNTDSKEAIKNAVIALTGTELTVENFSAIVTVLGNKVYEIKQEINNAISYDGK